MNFNLKQVDKISADKIQSKKYYMTDKKAVKDRVKQNSLLVLGPFSIVIS